MKLLRSFLSLVAIIALIFLPSADVLVVSASTSYGTIDTTNKYARGLATGTGSFNFGTAEGDVHVSDSALTGYVWSDMYGWINLAPTGYGVTNDSEGNLSGYAWGQNIGWINFNPSSSGVRVQINSSGDFIGYAWSQNIGWIVFNCVTNSTCGSDSFKVSTDWRPASVRNVVTSGGGGGGGGGSGSGVTGTTPITPTIPPTEPPVDTSEPPAPPVTPPEQPITPVTPDPTAPNVSTPGEVGGEASGASGSGSSQSSGGGGGGGVSEVFDNAVVQIKESVVFARETVREVARQTREIVQSPTGSAVTKTVSTVGVVAGGVVTASSLFLNPLSFSELFFLPLRLWGILLAAFGLKKRHLPWGTVYDSVTKQPLDPAYVVLQDMNGKEVNTSITDLDGRYGFLLSPGTYKIVANKTNYIFPSVKLAGKDHDELYGDLYFGDTLTVSDAGAIVTKNIPLDPEHFDWNEFAKGNKKLMVFYTKRDRIMKKISDVMFVVGFVVATIALFAAPKPYNTAIFAMYLVLLALRKFGPRSKQNSSVIEKETGLPLAFAIVRIHSIDLERELMHRVTDKFGRFYALVPQGKYYVTVEKKNDDESYSLIHTSPTIDAVKGVIDQKFIV